MSRLTELYRAFEDHNGELVVLDPDERHQVEFENLQDRYFSLASRIENILHVADATAADTSASIVEGRSNDVASSVSAKKRRIKLPDAPLPTFDGLQTDLSEIDKLHYLKSASTGEAANKIRIFEIDGINYSKAWELLEPDEAQQHVASLHALGVNVGSEIVVHILESKLPKLPKVSVRKFTGTHQWWHVGSASNPADAISRGQTPRDFIRNRTWFAGPSWLSEDEHQWPNKIIRVIEIPELKRNTCLIAIQTDLNIFLKFSSYQRLLRIVAYCLRFLPVNKHRGLPCAEEIGNAEMLVLKLLQAIRFSDEIKQLNMGVLKKSKFISLNRERYLSACRFLAFEEEQY
ncbi:hypothetical protein ALC62_15977 [Cyphomyrmex costatus]|uniref:Uncharacterized protein n=1 Tax=Cyphomyrmex costatus TaxID=456900 RepID=A0A151I6A1_9HYME|nr:hypothetical protein ALC62_15977 [Cyphomyrmex costatus]